MLTIVIKQKITRRYGNDCHQTEVNTQIW